MECRDRADILWRCQLKPKRLIERRRKPAHRTARPADVLQQLTRTLDALPQWSHLDVATARGEGNLGVKFVGLIRYRKEIPTLLSWIMDRTPAPRRQRLLGGDFLQVGFIRRNALQALSEMDPCALRERSIPRP